MKEQQNNKTIKLTVAQAIIKYLNNQYVERDGAQNKFFAGCLGIFGHGNVAGIGQALQEYPSMKYIMTRNEQASVHMAIAYAKMKNRLESFLCSQANRRLSSLRAVGNQSRFAAWVGLRREIARRFLPNSPAA